MNDRELEQLMNAQLDGAATSEESERLSKALAAREDARAAYRKLGGVFAALSNMETEEPPPDLKQNVLRSIRQRAGRKERGGWVESLSAVLRGRPVLRYAYSFAGGAALGVLAFALVTGNLMTNSSGLDPSSFTGAMVPPPGAASYKHIASRDFPLTRGHVLVETLSGKDGIVARITARAPKGTDLVLSFSPGAWSATGMVQKTVGNEVMLGFDRLSVRMQQFGESQYLLYLARKGPAGSPLRITIHSPDGFVHGGLETGTPRSGG